MQINCFYFGKFGYTIVPSQIQEDVQRIKDSGATYVTLNVLEQDFKSAKENTQLTVNEILKAGLKPILATERWYGIFGGVQHYPSVFTLKNPETQVIKENGEVYMTELGPISSLYNEKTEKQIRKNVDRTFDMWGFDGLMWYEPKLQQDFSDLAASRLGNDNSLKNHLAFCQNVFNSYHKRIQDKYGDKIIGWLHHPNETEEQIRAFSDLDGLSFSGNQQGLEDDVSTAFRQNKRLNYFSIINHVGLNKDQHNLLEQRLDQVIASNPDILGYYYYPGNVEAPDEAMKIIFDAIKQKV